MLSFYTRTWPPVGRWLGRRGRAGRTRADDRAPAPIRRDRTTRRDGPRRRARDDAGPTDGRRGRDPPDAADPRRGLRQGRRLRIGSGRARRGRPGARPRCPAGGSMPALIGAVEFGSYTRQPRVGNSGPVVWRDDRVRSTHNRVGLRNPGAAAAAAFLGARRAQLPAAWGVSLAVSPGVEDPTRAPCSCATPRRASSGRSSAARRRPRSRVSAVAGVVHAQPELPEHRGRPGRSPDRRSRAAPHPDRRRHRVGTAVGQGRAGPLGDAIRRARGRALRRRRPSRRRHEHAGRSRADGAVDRRARWCAAAPARAGRRRPPDRGDRPTRVQPRCRRFRGRPRGARPHRVPRRRREGRDAVLGARVPRAARARAHPARSRTQGA